VIRYSEAFKLRLVEDIGNGKYKSLDEARRRNGIRGGSTVKGWIKRYGREEMLPKRIRVETMKETDELKAAKRRIRELEAAKEGGGQRTDRTTGSGGTCVAAAARGREITPQLGVETGRSGGVDRSGPVFRGVAGEIAAARAA
jgi:transposase-like protein